MRDEGMRDVAVCRGLHRAARAVRDGGIEAEPTRNATLMGETAEVRGVTIMAANPTHASRPSTRKDGIRPKDTSSPHPSLSLMVRPRFYNAYWVCPGP
ncbi:hypothetical protein F4824DRAFT_249132 [Ustulina deusta]|nr:hypothetical protein F4824DRAFT_249132 [Ustulina deusta]